MSSRSWNLVRLLSMLGMVLMLVMHQVTEHRLRTELAAQRRTIEHELEVIEQQNKTLERATRLIETLRAACGVPAQYARYTQ